MTNEINRNDLDFGDDADATAPPDAAFDAWIRSVAPTLNAPTATPRQAMWDAIERAGATARAAEEGRIAGVIPIRRRPWRLMSMIAAALLLGIALDRIVLDGRSGATDPAAVATAPAPVPASATSVSASLPYKLAATQTLTQAEALITAFRANDGAPTNPVERVQLGQWGRDVLRGTRLLIDSPAGNDPQFRALLVDLELVLVQVIQLSGTPLDPADRALVDRALEDSELLSRIRTAVPAGVSAASAASDD